MHGGEHVGRGSATACCACSTPCANGRCAALRQLGASAGISFPTASKAMLTLVQIGIARELTGQRRNRVFVYDAYLNILNEGGEAL